MYSVVCPILGWDNSNIISFSPNVSIKTEVNQKGIWIFSYLNCNLEISIIKNRNSQPSLITWLEFSQQKKIDSCDRFGLTLIMQAIIGYSLQQIEKHFNKRTFSITYWFCKYQLTGFLERVRCGGNVSKSSKLS